MNKNKPGVVYKITNIQNNKCYIGMTTQNFKYYMTGRIKMASLCERGEKVLYDAFKDFGVNNFKWEILGHCNNWAELLLCEEECIAFFQSHLDIYGYNVSKKHGGKGHEKGELCPLYGTKQTKEHSLKRALANTGKKRSEDFCRENSKRQIGLQAGKDNPRCVDVDIDLILKLKEEGNTIEEIATLLRVSKGIIKRRIESPDKYR